MRRAPPSAAVLAAAALAAAAGLLLVNPGLLFPTPTPTPTPNPSSPNPNQPNTLFANTPTNLPDAVPESPRQYQTYGHPRRYWTGRDNNSPIWAERLAADGAPQPPAEFAAIFATAAGRRWQTLRPGDQLALPSYTAHWIYSRNITMSWNFMREPAAAATATTSDWSGSGSGSGSGSDLSDATPQPIPRPPNEPEADIVRGSARDWPAVARPLHPRELAAPAFAAQFELSESVLLCARGLCTFYPEELRDSRTTQNITAFASVPDFVARGLYNAHDYDCCLGILRLRRDSPVLCGPAPLVRFGADGTNAAMCPASRSAPVAANTADTATEISSSIWVSRGSIDTGLHWDRPDNTLLLVRGEKRVLSFPPSQRPLLFPPPMAGAAEDSDDEGGEDGNSGSVNDCDADAESCPEQSRPEPPAASADPTREAAFQEALWTLLAEYGVKEGDPMPSDLGNDFGDRLAALTESILQDVDSPDPRPGPRPSRDDSADLDF